MLNRCWCSRESHFVYRMRKKTLNEIKSFAEVKWIFHTEQHGVLAVCRTRQMLIALCYAVLCASVKTGFSTLTFFMNFSLVVVRFFPTTKGNLNKFLFQSHTVSTCKSRCSSTFFVPNSCLPSSVSLSLWVWVCLPSMYEEIVPWWWSNRFLLCFSLHNKSWLIRNAGIRR